MQLNILEEFTLLALDDEKGTFLTDSLYFTLSISGCILLHLTLSGKIALENKKIIVLSSEPDKNEVINPFLEEIIQSKKARSIEYWLEHIEPKASKITNAVIDGLIEKKILEKQENKFLWVFTQKKYPTTDASIENELKARLSKIAEGRKHPSDSELILFNLIKTCELERAVFGKEFYKRHKDHIKKVIKGDQLSDALQKQIYASQEAIMASITAVSTAAIAATIIIN